MNSRQEPSHIPEDQQFAVMLPCEPDQFGAFVSSLLGQPQTISKDFEGIFCITKNDVSNLHHTIEQRIHQQNDASLIQFTVKIFYNDKSSVLLNSFSDFNHYSEVKPLESIGARLTWTYLIKFKNKEVPEKQEISILFRTNSDYKLPFFIRDMELGDGAISVEIKHTDRTWGEDIVSLTSGCIENFKIEINKYKYFVYKNSSSIGLLAGLFMFFNGLVGATVTINSFYGELAQKIKSINPSINAASENISAKINFLLDISTNGEIYKFNLMVSGFIILFLLSSIIFGIVVAATADSKPRNIVALSKKSEDARLLLQNKPNNDWRIFLLSIFGGVISGLIANYIFLKYVTNG